MSNARWLIYGAYGYTGRLVLEEAVRRGHRPLLAGRSAGQLAPLAEKFGLNWSSFGLDDTPALSKAVAEVDLVLHVAGPFVHTSSPMLAACLAGKTNYIDISGEYPVFQQTLAHHEAARQQRIVLVSGVGFDVIPTDCLARYVADQLPDATALEIALDINSGYSTGTAKTVLEIIPERGGSLVRRDGQLKPYPLGKDRQQVEFTTGVRTVTPVPLADLVSAYRTTGIPNITTHLAVSRTFLTLSRFATSRGKKLLAARRGRRFLQKIVDTAGREPNPGLERRSRSSVWVKAANGVGHLAQAWLETPGTYHLTAVGSVRAVEKILAQQPTGALTPALAFGPDFVLEIDGVKRFDGLGN